MVAGGSDDAGGMPDREKKRADALATIQKLGEDYEVWAGEDLEKAKQALEAARALPADRQPHIQEIFHIIHNMMGQGSSFGYDLITMIGQSLHDFIRHTPDATDAELEVIGYHLEVIGVVLGKRIKGSGGPLADKVTTRLGQIAAVARE